MCFAPQRRAIFGHRTFKKWSGPVCFYTFWLTNMLRATAACHFWTSQLPKWLRPCGVLYILTCTNVLRATAACNFWTSQLPKWLRECGVLCILTCKCAFRHSRVLFLNIATSKMAPALRCFVHFDAQMCFAPQPRAIFHLSARTAPSAPAALAKLLFEHQEPRLIEKTQRFATSLTFGAHVELLATDSTRMLIFLLLTLHACWSSCYWLYTHVDLLATDMTAVRLCFSTLHIVGS